MIKPKAILISDIHFNLNTLPLASQALCAAIETANRLQVPLIIAGDLHDTKAIIRAEVANRLIELLSEAKVKTFILVGNHDLINEKAHFHGLNYLKPYATIIDSQTYLAQHGMILIPYMTDSDQLLSLIKALPRGSNGCKLLIMHQGFRGAWMGDYIQDKTSIDIEAVKDFTVYSGHYHRHQTIGTVTYIGSPFTMSFGEASDPEKGFLIVNEDGSFTRELLGLRRHIIVDRTLDEILVASRGELDSYRPDDLIWLKVRGPRLELLKLNKLEIGLKLFGFPNYKLDLIANESKEIRKQSKHQELTDGDLFDTIIDHTSETDIEKSYLKKLWRELV